MSKNTTMSFNIEGIFFVVINNAEDVKDAESVVRKMMLDNNIKCYIIESEKIERGNNLGKKEKGGK